jgi:hypothetical protein
MKLQTGDVIVVHGSKEAERDLVKYTDASALVTFLRERDDPDELFRSNEEYMRDVNTEFKKIYNIEEKVIIPFHNEEAFVNAMFRLGVFAKTTLN